MVYPALPVKLGKLQCLFDKSQYKYEYQTIRLGVDEFVPESERFDSKNVTKIAIYFDNQKQGKASLDNIGFYQK